MKNEEIFKNLTDIIDKFEDLDDVPDSVYDIQDELTSLRCRVAGHRFDYDMCGYWQHKYCLMCGASQYPKLAGQKCSVLTAEMGKMTEEEYLASKNIA